MTTRSSYRCSNQTREPAIKLRSRPLRSIGRASIVVHKEPRFGAERSINLLLALGVSITSRHVDIRATAHPQHSKTLLHYTLTQTHYTKLDQPQSSSPVPLKSNLNVNQVPLSPSDFNSLDPGTRKIEAKEAAVRDERTERRTDHTALSVRCGTIEHMTDVAQTVAVAVVAVVANVRTLHNDEDEAQL